LTAYDDRDTTVGRGVILSGVHFEVHRFHGDLIYGRRLGHEPPESVGFAICRIQPRKNPAVKTGLTPTMIREGNFPQLYAASASAAAVPSSSTASSSTSPSSSSAAPATQSQPQPQAQTQDKKKQQTSEIDDKSKAVESKADYIYIVITYLSPTVSARVVPQLSNFAKKFVNHVKA